MAGIPSKNTVVKIDNAANTLTTVANINGADLASAVAELDVSSMGEDDMEYIPGQRSHTFSGGGPWTAADDALFNGILGTSDRDIEVFPDGDASGKIKYAAKAFVTAYSRSTSLGSPGTYSVTMRISGAVTRSTV